MNCVQTMQKYTCENELRIEIEYNNSSNENEDGEKGDQIDEVNMQKRLRPFVLVDTEFKMEKK